MLPSRAVYPAVGQRSFFPRLVSSRNLTGYHHLYLWRLDSGDFVGDSRSAHSSRSRAPRHLTHLIPQTGDDSSHSSRETLSSAIRWPYSASQ